MDWRKAVDDIKQHFGALGTGIEEIVTAARKEVWERMRERCQLVEYGSGFVCMNATAETVLCAFDSCPLLQREKECQTG